MSEPPNKMREDHWRMWKSWSLLSLGGLLTLLALTFYQRLVWSHVSLAALGGMGFEAWWWQRLKPRVELMQRAGQTCYRIVASMHGPRVLLERVVEFFLEVFLIDEFSPVLSVLGIVAFVLFVPILVWLNFSVLAPICSVGVSFFVGMTLLRLFHVIRFERTHGPLYRYAHVRASVTGSESLPGTVGTVFQRLDPKGKIKIHGVLWNATSVDESPIEEGLEVIIESRSGLMLHVRQRDAMNESEVSDSVK